MWRQLPFESDDVCSLNTSIAFVDFIWATFGPILGGATLAVISHSRLRDSVKFIASLKQLRVTWIDVVPSQLHLLVSTLKQSASDSKTIYAIRICLSSSEVLTPSMAQDVFDVLPNCALYNLYGPTEVASDATCARISRNDCKVGSRIPVGHPIDHTAIFIVDEDLNLVSPGAVGEICIAGYGLSIGYLGRSYLTDEKFAALAVNGMHYSVYRTGDLGRLGIDGSLDYLGRRDSQVKVRGFRVELEEIEAAMVRMSGVVEVVARVAHTDVGTPVIEALIVNCSTSGACEIELACLYGSVPFHYRSFHSAPYKREN